MNRDPRIALSQELEAKQTLLDQSAPWPSRIPISSPTALVQTSNGEARLLAVGCPVDQGERYGDCLTYGPGHYETWAHWRRDRTVDPALRAIVQAYEYEDWPRGRIVCDRSRDLFILSADRKLMTPATIARIETQFHLRRNAPKSQATYAIRARRLRTG